ncbi:MULTISPECIES: ABC transporter permease [Lysinibacillus]|nr:ABC transporter permease [Lysinibacillus capsici]
MMRSLKANLSLIFSHKSLIAQFTKREISARYKGSYLGIVWSFVTPLLMLTIYTFVFSVVFQARWGGNGETNKIEFALILFAGLTVFNIFSEVISRSPSLITSNVNYVKKVVFPLEILPIVALGSALFHALISLFILVIGVYIALGTLNWTIILFPLVILPLLLVILGMTWILSSLGVYIRDVGQVISVAIPALMFLTPIFYPISSIPEELQFLYYFNPLGYVVEDARRVLIWGYLPHWEWFGYGMVIGVIIMVLGYVWFKKTRKGFADVI